VDVTARMLRLLSLLQSHRQWSGTELADRLEVSPRTLRRDIDRLRTLGYTVHSQRGFDGGYQLDSGSALPPLLFDDQEAVAIAVGLRTATVGLEGIEEISVQALAKLERVLPARLRSRISAFTTHTVPVVWPGPTVDPTALTIIAQACRDQERLRFGYQTREGAEGERRVEPYRLVVAGRRWYLLAWDLDRDDWRTFRVDRLHDVASTGWRFEARTLPAEDVAAFVAAAFANVPARYEARVTLHASAADVAGRLGHLEGAVEPLDEHTSLLRSRSDSLEWLAAGLTVIGVDFEVEGPPELIEHLRRLTVRLSAAVPA
jgi:predicted DNA-binding transcriptional regulator YafY